MSQRSAPPPHAIVLQMLTGRWVSTAIATVAKFAQTALSEPLRSHANPCLRNMAMMFLDDWFTRKHIIHDWDDEQSTRILSNCRTAIAPGGKLLVIDQVVGPRNEPGLAKLMDLEMLVNPGGLERTEEQWTKLFAASGFHLAQIIRTPVPQCVIEGVPVG